MSADNFYLIRRAPGGKFVPLMGFASDEEQPIVTFDRPRELHDTAEAALASVIDSYAEYGHDVHPECAEPATVVHEVPAVFQRVWDAELADRARQRLTEYEFDYEAAMYVIYDVAQRAAAAAVAELLGGEEAGAGERPSTVERAFGFAPTH